MGDPLLGQVYAPASHSSPHPPRPAHLLGLLGLHTDVSTVDGFHQSSDGHDVCIFIVKSFSKVSLIKSKLRTTMQRERMKRGGEKKRREGEEGKEWATHFLGQVYAPASHSSPHPPRRLKRLEASCLRQLPPSPVEKSQRLDPPLQMKLDRHNLIVYVQETRPNRHNQQYNAVVILY